VQAVNGRDAVIDAEADDDLNDRKVAEVTTPSRGAEALAGDRWLS
jgi:hypothetical protein